MATNKVDNNDTKKVFKELGTCSRTFFHLLNREFGNQLETEEQAADPLAGGIMQKGQHHGSLQVWCHNIHWILVCRFFCAEYDV